MKAAFFFYLCVQNNSCMKKNITSSIFAVFLLCFNFLTAQNYVPAVGKLNNGQNLNGLLKNNFQDDDEFIFFKENNQEKRINVKDIAELLIEGKEQYIAKKVSFHPNRLLTAKQISETLETDLQLRDSRHVLLRLLVKGEVNLYRTKINGKSLYYYNKSNANDLEYLEYFTYKTADDLIKTNLQFKRQLLKDANCGGLIADSFQYIDYSEKDLIEVINRHNVCVNGSSTVVNEVAGDGNNFRTYVFGGLKLINGVLESDSFLSSNKFTDPHVSPSLGVEFSYTGLARSKKVEIFSRIDYSTINFYQSATAQTPLGITSYDEDIEYKASVLGVVVGYRYNFNSLADVKKNNFAIDFGFSSAIPLNPSLVYRNKLTQSPDFGSVDLSSSVNNVVFGLSFGTSYTYAKRYTVEARYTASSNYNDKLSILKSNFSNFNIGFKYLILE